MKAHRYILFMVLAALSMISCSTTRVLQDGQYRLAKNKIEIKNDRKFNPNQLQSYLKQKPKNFWQTL